jgi:hypothetical protein
MLISVLIAAAAIVATWRQRQTLMIMAPRESSI